MGYTHYWYRPEHLDVENYVLWQEDVKKVIDFTDVSICSGTGFGKPTFKDGVTRFNGNGKQHIEYDRMNVLYPDWAAMLGRVDGDDHETFCVDRLFTNEYRSADEKGWYFDFTKTAHKPYDVVVVAALILLAYHFPEGCEISSDGYVKDWQAGLELAENATGRILMIPFQDEREEVA